VAILLAHRGKRPRIAPSAYVAPNAVVCGDVTIGDEARVLFGAVLTADGGPVEVGRRCIVMEHALLRGREGHPLRVGDHVLVGPHAHLNGTTVDDEVFLATGVSLFPGSRVGSRSEVRIGAVVHVNTEVPPETTVPIGWVALGRPAELFPPDRDDQIRPAQKRLDFPGTVFGLTRPEASMRAVTEIYSEMFGHHLADEELEPVVEARDER